MLTCSREKRLDAGKTGHERANPHMPGPPRWTCSSRLLRGVCPSSIAKDVASVDSPVNLGTPGGSLKVRCITSEHRECCRRQSGGTRSRGKACGRSPAFRNNYAVQIIRIRSLAYFVPKDGTTPAKFWNTFHGPIRNTAVLPLTRF